MEQARDELEVHFCNICNASIPESALRDGKAIRIDDKVVPTASGEPRPATSNGGLLAGAFVLLVAVTAAAVFLDWRLSQESMRVGQDIGGFGTRVERVADRLDAIDARLTKSVATTDLEPLAERLADVEKAVAESDQRVGAATEGTGGRLDALKASLEAIHDEQVKMSARFALLQDEVRSLGGEIADLRATPRAAPQQPVPGTPDAVPDEPPKPAVDDGLPPEIAHNVARLGDADDGARFDAVEKLLATKDERVYPLILPLAKDSDVWVRRLVIEGLASYHSKDTVDALITALADPESIVRYEAYNSLKKLTGQEIPFDPDGSSEQRAAAQRRWKQWWDKNRDGF